MRDGYYLSTYLNPVGGYRLSNLWLRHDENFSLWQKEGSTVRLLGHWELERLSGQKQHETPFLEPDDMRALLDDVLAEYSVKVDDVNAVWGTPGLAQGPAAAVSRYPGIAAHAVGHLYSAMLLDSEAFFDGTVIGLAVDRGPDLALDKYYKKNWFAGGFARHGELSVFPVDSPGALYGAAKDHFGLREGTLMALATATQATGACDREAILSEFAFRGVGVPERIPLAFERIAAEVARGHTGDTRFTDSECYASAVMKEVQAISVMMMERTLDDVLARFPAEPAETCLALAGGYALNCPTNSHLMRKQREWWRPVAPVVLEDEVGDWFEDSRPSAFMLETFRVVEAKRDLIPAVAHLDSSARVQSLNEEQNPLLHGLLRAFQERTGVPALCNTSLNDRGEPIVDTIAEAINFCLRKGVEVAYLDGHRVTFRAQESYPEAGPLRRRHAEFFEIDRSRAERVRSRLNPHGLTDLEFYLYHDDLQLMADHDIRSFDGAEQVRAVLRQRLLADPGIQVWAEANAARNAARFAQFDVPQPTW